MYTGGEDGIVRLWDYQRTNYQRSAISRHTNIGGEINAVFLHPNQRELYVADQSGFIYIWNVFTDSVHKLFVTGDGFVSHLAYDNECRLLAAVDSRGFCYIFRVAPYYSKDQLPKGFKNGLLTEGGFLHRKLKFKAHDKYVLKCYFSPDSTLLATSSGDQTVKFWRTSDLSLMNTSGKGSAEDAAYSAELNAINKERASGETVSRKKSVSQSSNSGQELPKGQLMIKDADWFDDSQVPSTFAYGSSGVSALNRPPPCFLRPRKHRQCRSCLINNNLGTSCCTGFQGELAYVPSSGGTSSGGGLSGSGNQVPMLKPQMNTMSKITWNLVMSNKQSGSNGNGPNSPTAAGGGGASAVPNANQTANAPSRRVSMDHSKEFANNTGYLASQSTNGHPHHFHVHHHYPRKPALPKHFARYTAAVQQQGPTSNRTISDSTGQNRVSYSNFEPRTRRRTTSKSMLDNGEAGDLINDDQVELDENDLSEDYEFYALLKEMRLIKGASGGGAKKGDSLR